MRLEDKLQMVKARLDDIQIRDQSQFEESTWSRLQTPRRRMKRSRITSLVVAVSPLIVLGIVAWTYHENHHASKVQVPTLLQTPRKTSATTLHVPNTITVKPFVSSFDWAGEKFKPGIDNKNLFAIPTKSTAQVLYQFNHVSNPVSLQYALQHAGFTILRPKNLNPGWMSVDQKTWIQNVYLVKQGKNTGQVVKRFMAYGQVLETNKNQAIVVQEKQNSFLTDVYQKSKGTTNPYIKNSVYGTEVLDPRTTFLISGLPPLDLAFVQNQGGIAYTPHAATKDPHLNILLYHLDTQNQTVTEVIFSGNQKTSLQDMYETMLNYIS